MRCQLLATLKYPSPSTSAQADLQLYSQCWILEPGAVSYLRISRSALVLRKHMEEPVVPSHIGGGSTEMGALGYDHITQDITIKDSSKEERTHQLTFISADIVKGVDIILGYDWIRTHRPVYEWIPKSWAWSPGPVSVSAPHDTFKIQLTSTTATGEHAITALLDTGAPNIISRDIETWLGLTKIDPTADTLDFNGNIPHTFGYFSMNSQITEDMGSSKDVGLIVISAAVVGFEILLGLDFLQKYKTVCDWTNNSWT